MSVEIRTEQLDTLMEQAGDLSDTVARQLAEQVLAEIRWSGQSPSTEGEPPAILTGELADSIRVEFSGMGYRVGSPLGYGRMLEYGTLTMAARPWLRPAVERVRVRLADIVREIWAAQGIQADEAVEEPFLAE